MNYKPKDNLRKYIENISVDETDYTPTSYKVLLSRLEEAKTELNKWFTSPSKIYSKKNLIETAINNLEKRADKTELYSELNSVLNINTLSYTTASLSCLSNAISNAESVLADQNVNQKDVDSAVEFLSNAKSSLKNASVGVYTVTIKRTMKSNHHVGDFWKFSCKRDGNEYNSGTQFQAALNSTESFSFTIMESDDVPEYGSTSMDITLSDGYTRTTYVTVTENRGKYSGNKAEWEFVITVSLIETLSVDEAETGLKYNYSIECANDAPAEINLYSNDDGYSNQTILLQSGDKFTLPTLVSNNKLFCGWYKDEAYTTPVTSESLAGVNDFYAKWLNVTSIEYKSDEELQTQVGATEKTISMIVMKSGLYKLYFSVTNQFTFVDVKISNKSIQKILYDSLVLGSQNDYYIYFEANIGDEIEFVLEGFDVAEFHGYVFKFEAVYMSETTRRETVVQAYKGSETVQVQYNQEYKLNPMNIIGYSFIGYYTVDGIKITDEYGNSIANYNILGNTRVYAKYSK